MKHNCHTKSSGTLQNRAVFRDGSFCFPPSVEPETITTGIKGKGMKTQTWHTGNYRAKLANAFVRTARSSLAVSEKIILAGGLRYFSRKPCAIRHGTAGQARNKISALQSRGCLTQKTKGMSRSNFTPMGRFKEIIDRYGLKLMEVGTNHLRIFADNRKLFDYYPLRMKLFDYRQWKQLTYPSLIEGADKWETELDEIIKRLMVSPQ